MDLNSSIPQQKLSVGQALARLRQIYQPGSKDLAIALGTSSTTYLKIERGQRDLTFLMALKLCRFYNLDVHDFISMLSDDELMRKDLTGIKALLKIEIKKAEVAKVKAAAEVVL